MMNSKTDYYSETIAQSAEEVGVILSTAQSDHIAKAVLISIECQSMAFYVPENPLKEENRKTEVELYRHQRKTICRVCNGHGSITTNFGIRSSTSSCSNCDGGFIYPSLQEANRYVQKVAL